MIKKIILFFAIISIAISSRAQFVNGIGIMGGVTFANQKWHFTELNQTQRQKFLFGFNGCLFAEFFSNPYVHWVSEIQFNQKGSKEKLNDATFRNRLNYFSWNNYLKFRIELFSGYPYMLIGPRLEYLFTQSTASPAIVGAFKKIHVSPDVGLGWEHIVFSQFKPFIEVHYNPDVLKWNAYKTDFLQIKNRSYEVRIGVKWAFSETDKGSGCPGVVR